jgi:hypothetical protein
VVGSQTASVGTPIRCAIVVIVNLSLDSHTSPMESQTGVRKRSKLTDEERDAIMEKQVREIDCD